MQFYNRLKTVVLPATKNTLIGSAAMAVLVACGGTGQDDGQVSTTQQQFSGRVIDGYLARTTVFLDSNNNGTRDAWESYAFTDNDGFYSYNPKTETDYCAEDTAAHHTLYCLESFTEYDDVVIRVDGGYDVLTGEPFYGQMSRRIKVTDAELPGGVISPLTSLVTSLESEQDISTVLESLGMTDADLAVDYLDTDGAGTIDDELLNTALTIHKVVTVLGDSLTDTYTEIGNNYGTPNDATSMVYSALAEAVQNLGIDAALLEESLHQTLDTAEAELRDVYAQRDFTLPPDMGDAQQPGEFARTAEIASDIAPVVDALINQQGAATTSLDVAGKARALESLVIKAMNENSGTDLSIANAVEFFVDAGNEPLIGALVDSLSADTADLKLLAKNNFKGADFDSALDVTQSSSVPDGVEPFSGIGGTTLRLSDMNPGIAPDALDDSEIEFYFSGDSSDLEGSFSACVKLITDAKSDGTLGDNDSRGEVATGFWSLLGAVDGKSYSVLVTVDFLGSTYQRIIKPAGTELVDGVSHLAVGFDDDGRLKTWHSVNGFVVGGTPAANNTECEARLPSRIGI